MEGIAYVDCIEILTELAITNKSPYEVVVEYGLSSPDRAVKNIWKDREKYREAAENDPKNDWGVEF